MLFIALGRALGGVFRPRLLVLHYLLGLLLAATVGGAASR